MEIRKIPISQVKPHPDNPRVPLTSQHSEYRQIKKSLKKFGLVLPLVCSSRTNYILGGNQRYSVLLTEGVKEVNVVFVDLDPQREKELMIALNGIYGLWDYPKLADILRDFGQLPDFDFESIGFTVPDLSNILDNHLPLQDDTFDFDAALESTKEPVTKKGDVISLGMHHRLMCGDATSEEDMCMLLGDTRVDLLDIDWPYNVNYMGGNCPRVDTRPKKSRRWSKIYSDNLPQSEYEVFMRKVLTNIKLNLKPGGVFYQWQAHRQLGPLYQILIDLDFHVSCLICWKKQSAPISYADYSFQTEQAVYGWLKGESHYFAGKPGASNLWEIKRDSTKLYEHPCQKPVSLAQKAIKNSTRLNDVVLDVFLGSGSVLIAAESLSRRCFAMELDPKYCDVIVKRYINFVGKSKVSSEILNKYCEEV
ncbi:MAG: ParB N-terminal domain-containing protein [Candidatus Omnitrophica bacterium]|nr:ParB N-terminal domain-containing protein [Candidatus Omnitrophota bacterium]